MSWSFFTQRRITIILFVLSIVVHFAWLGTPNSAVFDEVHFGKFFTAYFTHQYYFDIHPPLGKLIIAGWGWLWGFHPGFSFSSIGEVYPDHFYIILRTLPSLAGALLPLVVFGIARRLRISLRAATLAGIFVALDNALLVQSRLILLDSFLLLFGFTAIYCYLRWRDSSATWTLTAAGAFGGMAMSIKWTGVTFLSLIVLLEIIRFFRTRTMPSWIAFLRQSVALIVIPLAIYVGVFAIHFSLLTKSGAGDAFMTRNFQSGLEGNHLYGDPTLTPPNLLQKIADLNSEMYRSNNRLSATHPYSSKWYTWPLMLRPIFYWIEGNARIYLIGNPAVWWLSAVAMATLLAQLMASGVRALKMTPAIILIGWTSNLLPFIGISRVMFLYHYFTALLWAILALAFVVDQSHLSKRSYAALCAIALALFVFFAPLSYGLPMSASAQHARAWLATWR